jgi:hypothetical protein
MATYLMAEPYRLLHSVQEILFLEWDPIGVNGNALCRNEYDTYATTVWNLLQSGADEFKIASRLSLFQRGNMGLSVVNEELNRKVARRLVGLVKTRSKNATRP